jgi:hypothetical protein
MRNYVNLIKQQQVLPSIMKPETDEDVLSKSAEINKI